MKKNLLSALLPALLALLALTGGALAAPYPEEPDGDRAAYYQADPAAPPVLESARETLDVSVTTGNASDVAAFSASLSMEVRGASIYRKGGKVYGFEYCSGTEFSEAAAVQHSHHWDGDEEALPGGYGFSYTGAVPCLPGRTYWYRAYFAFIDESTGEEWPIFIGEVKSFATPGAGTLPQLTPGSPAEFSLVDGASEIWSLTAETSGFYTLALEGAYDAQADRFICAGGDQDWREVRRGEPFYAEAGKPLYVRLDAHSWGTGPVAGTLAAVPFETKELQPGEPVTVLAKGDSYVQFTPASSGTWLLSLDVEGGTSGSILPWSSEAGKWDYNASAHSGTGAVRMAVELKAGVTYYFCVRPGYSVSGTLLIRPYTPPEGGYAISLGNVQLDYDSMTAAVPILIECPAGENITLATVVEMGGRKFSMGGGGSSWNSAVRTWDGSFPLIPVPGREYRYRAYLEVRDETEKTRIYENGDPELWHTFRVPDSLPAQALPPDAETAVEGSGRLRLLSFTPAEGGLYTFTRPVYGSGDPLLYWDPETEQWRDIGEGLTLALLAGETRYLRAYWSVTVGRPAEPLAVRRGGTVLSAADAGEAAACVFAAFGGPGQGLDAALKTGSGPLSAELEAEAAGAVRVFRLDAGWRPLGPALELPVRDP